MAEREDEGRGRDVDGWDEDEAEDKLAYSTPTRPLELPPFSLLPLLNPVFAPSSSSRPTSPSKPPSSPPSSRFGQLVSSVAAGAGAAAAAATGADAGGGAGAALGGQKQLTVRTLEAGDQRVWLAASDGRVRLYEVSDEAGELNAGPGPAIGMLSPPGSPGSAGRRTPVRPPPALDLVDEVFPTTSKKAADRIALLPQVDKAVILCEGQLTFHSLPLLAPLPASSFPTIKGVMSFALDEDELAAGVGHGGEETGGGEKKGMQIVVVKRKTVHWLRVTSDGIERIKDLPLRGGALITLLRNSRICIADAENYSIVDLEAAEALPLLPISQEPHPDPLPAPSSAAASSSTAGAEGGAVTPPPPPGGPDPRHRPAIACVGENEYLFASHTGATTLGVFVNEVGQPSRGTLEWASNLRSLVVDSQYSIALLSNNTVEIHSLHSQEIVQVVTLPTSPSPSSSSAPSLLSTFQPRALVKSWLGLELGSATGANKLEIVDVPLLPSSSSSAAGEPPSTPPRRRSRSHSRTSLTPSLRSSLRSPTDASSPSGPGRPTTTRILLQGRNGLFALTPLTLVVQVDALLERGREGDAERLVEEFEEGLGAGQKGERETLELSYAHLRLFFLSLRSLSFQSAFDHFLKSGADPRVVVRMFEELPGRELMQGEEERVEVVRGVEAEVRRGRTVDEYILDNLNRHYSPHLQPSVESASSTVELRATFAMAAREGLFGYLVKWRERRRSGEEGAEEGEV
ncbi:hypothetical protein JCM6882_006088 [Rhodosporidiobolus microsporus]